MINFDHWDLIARKINGELSSEEEENFLTWINSDPQNASLFKEAQTIWKGSGNIRNEFEPDTDKGWTKLQSAIQQKSVINIHRSKFSWIKIAAVIISLISVGILIRYLLHHESGNTSFAMIEIKTADSVKVFRLPDSSMITLNKNSQVSFSEKFHDSIRMVKLNGEAFFQVAENPEQPFVIYAGGTETRVLGTSFNIKSYEKEKEVEVTVVSGKVKFKPGTGYDYQLEANDQVVYNRDGNAIQRRKAKKTNWWNKLKLEKDTDEILKKARKEIKKIK